MASFEMMVVKLVQPAEHLEITPLLIDTIFFGEHYEIPISVI